LEKFGISEDFSISESFWVSESFRFRFYLSCTAAFGLAIQGLGGARRRTRLSAARSAIPVMKALFAEQ